MVELSWSSAKDEEVLMEILQVMRFASNSEIMLSREESIDLVRQFVKKENNVNHMIAVGAVMRETAQEVGEDPVRWEMVGILHDIDFEICSGPEDHTIKAKEILAGRVDEEDMESIMAHNHENTGVAVDSRLKRGLIACDAVSGLIIACALVMPSKKLADVQPSSVIKKFGSKDFAKGVSRQRILLCEHLGMERDDFLKVALRGMQKVAPELGL